LDDGASFHYLSNKVVEGCPTMNEAAKAADAARVCERGSIGTLREE
jgi:hypothetical protein